MLQWFYEGRKAPVAPYAELIRDYRPDSPTAHWDQDYVNELFTAEEVELLRDYLERRGFRVVVEEVPLPVEPGQVPLGSIPMTKNNDLYLLAAEPGYPLPFPVLAYFEIPHPPGAVDLGVRYLQAALHMLELPEVPEERLQEVVQRLKQGQGWQVTRIVGTSG